MEKNTTGKCRLRERTALIDSGVRHCRFLLPPGVVRMRGAGRTELAQPCCQWLRAMLAYEYGTNAGDTTRDTDGEKRTWMDFFAIVHGTQKTNRIGCQI